MSVPLVTCLCLTRDRREWLPKAIACFRAQRYANRELLIVADKESDYAGLLPASSDRAPIRVVTTGPQPVGAKRNMGCIAASADPGSLIAVWDDDDHSDPNRLAWQAEDLLTSGRAVAGYRDMKFTDGANWWKYMGPSSFVLGTSLMFYRSWWQDHKFEEVNSGQDEAFAHRAYASGQLLELPDMDLMYATIHPGNTSARDLSNASAYRALPGFRWQERAA
jgi:glycosyltransferase involved in cell wall biosynthesis